MWFGFGYLKVSCMNQNIYSDDIFTHQYIKTKLTTCKYKETCNVYIFDYVILQKYNIYCFEYEYTTKFFILNMLNMPRFDFKSLLKNISSSETIIIKFYG